MTVPLGIAAEFEGPDELAAAVRALRAAGYARLEAYSPFPVGDVESATGDNSTPIAWIAGLSALAGGTAIALVQWWASASLHLDLGGRPQFPWPAFISTVVIVAILSSALGTFAGLMWLLDLPRVHHPAFSIPAFQKLWDRRFFVMIEADDPRFHADGTAAFLNGLSPRAVHLVWP